MCDQVPHTQLQTVTNSPLLNACENKAGRQWGGSRSYAVTLSGMLMSLQVNGGQWAPHGPLLVPWPLVFPSQFTHTKRRQWHGATFPMSSQAGERGVLLQTCCPVYRMLMSTHDVTDMAFKFGNTMIYIFPLNSPIKSNLYLLYTARASMSRLAKVKTMSPSMIFDLRIIFYVSQIH